MKTWHDVEGFFDYPYIYDHAVREAKKGDVLVEVGSWMGQSMAYLAQHLVLNGWEGGRLIAVDSFKGEIGEVAHQPTVAANGGSVRPRFEQNMKDCGIDHMIEIIEGDSAQSAERFEDGSVSFCFIDAAHDYESVIKDVLAWTPKMKPGGMMAGHDYPFFDVHKAVCECFAGESYMVAGSCWVKRFPHDKTPAQWREGIEEGKKLIASHNAK